MLLSHQHISAQCAAVTMHFAGNNNDIIIPATLLRPSLNVPHACLSLGLGKKCPKKGVLPNHPLPPKLSPFDRNHQEIASAGRTAISNQCTGFVPCPFCPAIRLALTSVFWSGGTYTGLQSTGGTSFFGLPVDCHKV